jgi:hypothetical protein
LDVLVLSDGSPLGRVCRYPQLDDHRKSKEKTDRNTTSERNQQRQTREYQTAEQNT